MSLNAKYYVCFFHNFMTNRAFFTKWKVQVHSQFWQKMPWSWNKCSKMMRCFVIHTCYPSSCDNLGSQLYTEVDLDHHMIICSSTLTLAYFYDKAVLLGQINKSCESSSWQNWLQYCLKCVEEEQLFTHIFRASR